MLEYDLIVDNYGDFYCCGERGYVNLRDPDLDFGLINTGFVFGLMKSFNVTLFYETIYFGESSLLDVAVELLICCLLLIVKC